MSDPRTRDALEQGAEPRIRPAAPPAADPLAFPAITTESVTPLRVPAMSREEAARRVAEIEAASLRAPSSTEISVRVVRPRGQPDFWDRMLGVFAIGVACVMLAMLAWGLVAMARGFEARGSSMNFSEAN